MLSRILIPLLISITPIVAAESSAPAAVRPETLAAVVQERRVVTFVYQGELRVVEPHSCGLVASSGEAVLHGYQITGGSSSGTLPGWRTFATAKITDFVITERTFAGPRPDYAKDRPKLAPAWAELAAAPQ